MPAALCDFRPQRKRRRLAKAKPPLDPRCRDPAIMLPVILEHLQDAVEAAKRTRSEIGIQPPECPRFYFQDALALHAIQRNVADAAGTVVAAWENVADIHNAHHRQLTLARKTLRQLQSLLNAIQAHLQKRLPAAPPTPRAPRSCCHASHTRSFSKI